MAFDIIIEPFAENDLNEIAEWYELEREGLGVNFLSEFISSTSLLSAKPLLFRKRHQDIRSLPMHTFPYSVYYFVISNSVHIIAVFHQKRNPRIWKTRNKY